MYERSEDWRNISFYMYLKWNALNLHVWILDSLFYPSNECFIIKNGVSDPEVYTEALDNPLNIFCLDPTILRQALPFRVDKEYRNVKQRKNLYFLRRYNVQLCIDLGVFVADRFIAKL